MVKIFKQLKNNLLDRGYSKTLVESAIKKARSVPREIALKKVFRNNFVLGRGGEEGETLSPATPHERVPESLRTVYHFAAYRPPCASS